MLIIPFISSLCAFFAPRSRVATSGWRPTENRFECRQITLLADHPLACPLRARTLRHTQSHDLTLTFAQMSQANTPSAASPLVLTEVQRAYLLFLGGFVAKAANNDPAAVRADWLLVPNLAAKWSIPLRDLERSLLDALVALQVFSGIPKTIQGFDAVHQARRHDFKLPVTKPAADYLWPNEVAANPNFGHPDFSRVPAPCGTCGDANSNAIREARGLATLQSIYTSTQPKLDKFLRSLHPSLHASITTHIYGAVMCTTSLKLFELEAVAVACLSGLHTPSQLLSHLRGALEVGLPSEFLTRLMEEVFEDVFQDDGVYGESQEVWRQLKRTRMEKTLGRPLDAEASATEAREALYQDHLRRSKRAERDRQKQMQEEDIFADDELGTAEAPRAPTRTAQAPGAAAPAETEPTEEQIESTMRTMMRQRSRQAAVEVASRKAGVAATTAEDRWPFPPHVLDPSAGGGMMSMGMGGSMGGMGGMDGGMGGMGGGMPPLRSRM